GTLPRLTLDQIRVWAEAHRAATGRWPRRNSGAIAGVPGETWAEIHRALWSGRRGLSGRSTLCQLLGPQTGAPVRSRPRLTLEQVLAWGDAHHAATGRWPAVKSGPIPGITGETWCAINASLRNGFRGLPPGMSLKKLFAERRLPAAGSEIDT